MTGVSLNSRICTMKERAILLTDQKAYLWSLFCSMNLPLLRGKARNTRALPQKSKIWTRISHRFWSSPTKKRNLIFIKKTTLGRQFLFNIIRSSEGSGPSIFGCRLNQFAAGASTSINIKSRQAGKKFLTHCSWSTRLEDRVFRKKTHSGGNPGINLSIERLKDELKRLFPKRFFGAAL